MGLDKFMEPRSGQMEESMKENGLTVKLAVKADFGMQMVTNMKVNGKRTRLTATDCICMRTEQNMLVIGKMICSTVMARRPGLTTLHSKANMLMAKSKDTELTNGPMVPVLLGLGRTTKLMVLELTLGLTVDSSKESGKTIICTEKANISGLTVDCTKGNISTIRSTATVSILGQTDASIMVSGQMENSMVKDCTVMQMVTLGLASGTKEEERLGSMKTET